MKRFGTILILMLLFLAACVPIQPLADAPVAPEPSAASDTADAQLATLKTLLQDKDFALEMASWLDAAYYKGQGAEVPEFLTEEDKSAVKEKSVTARTAGVVSGKVT